MAQADFPTKVRYVKEACLCNKCYKRKAEYHGPLKNGSWMFICGHCVIGRIDSRFKHGERIVETSQVTPTAIELTPVELIATGIASRRIQCPVCTLTRTVNEDEFGTMECEGCRGYMQVKRLY